MRQHLEGFFAALTFLTRIPAPAWGETSAERLQRASCFSPAVGWVVGIFSALCFALSALILPLPVAVALGMAASAWITGAIHEDAFADFCDGFGDAHDAEKTREIMKDPRTGAFGVLGLALMLLVKFVSLWEIGALLESSGAGLTNIPIAFVSEAVPALETLVFLGVTLVSAHALSRWAAVSFMRSHPYVGSGPDSKAAAMAGRMSEAELCFATFLGVAPLLLFVPLGHAEILLALAPVLLARHVVGRLFSGRLGGYTGDCLGAVQQTTEAAFYLGVCAIVFW